MFKKTEQYMYKQTTIMIITGDTQFPNKRRRKKTNGEEKSTGRLAKQGSHRKWQLKHSACKPHSDEDGIFQEAALTTQYY